MSGRIVFFTDGSASANSLGMQVRQLASLWNSSIQVNYLLALDRESLLGDEWITGSHTRKYFLNWYEHKIIEDAHSVINDFYDLAKNNDLKIYTDIQMSYGKGKANEIIIKKANQPETILLALPNPFFTKPVAEGGLKFNLKLVTAKIKCPLLIGPVPV